MAAARMVSPAMRPAAPLIGNDDPVLMIVFDQRSCEDQDAGADRPTDLGRPEVVEWDERFALSGARGLAVVVSQDDAGCARASTGSSRAEIRAVVAVWCRLSAPGRSAQPILSDENIDATGWMWARSTVERADVSPSSSSSRRRARLSLLLMVPIAQPQMSAASS